MGGKRIGEQVRRALIAAAKVAPVAVVIDASGCGSDSTCIAWGPASCPEGPAKLVPVTADAGAAANLSVCPTAAPGFDKQHGGYWDTGPGTLPPGTPACSPCAGWCIPYGICLAGGVASQWVQCAKTCPD